MPFPKEKPYYETNSLQGGIAFSTLAASLSVDQSHLLLVPLWFKNLPGLLLQRPFYLQHIA